MKNLIYLVLSVVVLVACGPAGPTEQALGAKCEKYKKGYKTAQTMDSLIVNADSLIHYVDLLEKHFPQNTSLMSWYFTAGEACLQKGDGPLAIEYFSKVKGDQEGVAADHATYMKGWAYEELLNDTRSAREAYREVIKNYPESIWADIAKSNLSNLGKTNKELIEELQKKNQAIQDSTAAAQE